MSIVADEGETSKDQQPESTATTLITVDEGVSNADKKIKMHMSPKLVPHLRYLQLLARCLIQSLRKVSSCSSNNN
jgi:hypothetical protein